MSQLKTASVLAFERKLDPSDALFYAGNWKEKNQLAGWEIISVLTKSVRGTISNRLKSGKADPAKLDAEVQKPNLQTVDVAALPHNADTLKVVFSLRVLAGTGVPSACNEAAYRDRLVQVIGNYRQEHGFKELARRYAHNLANGRFLWRNRLGAEQIEIRVERLKEGVADGRWEFDALKIPLKSFNEKNAQDKNIEALSSVVEAGLAGEEHVLLQVSAFVRLGKGQEVFPSQELIMEREKGSKSKTLYALNLGGQMVAAMHSQKIGNAVRTIDDWHPEGEIKGPIAVEPYGSVTTEGRAYRQPGKKMDFYTLLDDWLLKDNVPAPAQQHYVVANLVRGGVFGEKE